jgi:hypothetical protein
VVPFENVSPRDIRFLRVLWSGGIDGHSGC